MVGDVGANLPFDFYVSSSGWPDRAAADYGRGRE